MVVEGKVLDTEGKPIAGAILDTWETDGNGLYDTQVFYNYYFIVPRFVNDYMRSTVRLSK